MKSSPSSKPVASPVRRALASGDHRFDKAVSIGRCIADAVDNHNCLFHVLFLP